MRLMIVACACTAAWLGVSLVSVHAVQAEEPSDSILLNGALTHWSDEGPTHWRWLKESPALSKLNEERLGNPVISIRQPNGMFQDVVDESLRAGDRVVFEGYFRTGEDGMAFAELRTWYREAGVERPLVKANLRQPVPSGGWQYMRLVVTVPEDAPAFLRFSVDMREDMQSPLLISSLRAYVIPGIL